MNINPLPIPGSNVAHTILKHISKQGDEKSFGISLRKWEYNNQIEFAIVVAIAANSPASRVGISLGWTILRVNSINVQGMQLKNLLRLFSNTNELEIVFDTIPRCKYLWHRHGDIAMSIQQSISAVITQTKVSSNPVDPNAAKKQQPVGFRARLAAQARLKRQLRAETSNANNLLVREPATPNYNKSQKPNKETQVPYMLLDERACTTEETIDTSSRDSTQTINKLSISTANRDNQSKHANMEPQSATSELSQDALSTPIDSMNTTEDSTINSDVVESYIQLDIPDENGQERIAKRTSYSYRIKRKRSPVRGRTTSTKHNRTLHRQKHAKRQIVDERRDRKRKLAEDIPTLLMRSRRDILSASDSNSPCGTDSSDDNFDESIQSEESEYENSESQSDKSVTITNDLSSNHINITDRKDNILLQSKQKDDNRCMESNEAREKQNYHNSAHERKSNSKDTESKGIRYKQNHQNSRCEQKSSNDCLESKMTHSKQQHQRGRPDRQSNSKSLESKGTRDKHSHQSNERERRSSSEHLESMAACDKQHHQSSGRERKSLSVQRLVDMGFEKSDAELAVSTVGDNVEVAMAWLTSNFSERQFEKDLTRASIESEQSKRVEESRRRDKRNVETDTKVKTEGFSALYPDSVILGSNARAPYFKWMVSNRTQENSNDVKEVRKLLTKLLTLEQQAMRWYQDQPKHYMLELAERLEHALVTNMPSIDYDFVSDGMMNRVIWHKPMVETLKNEEETLKHILFDMPVVGCGVPKAFLKHIKNINFNLEEDGFEVL